MLGGSLTPLCVHGDAHGNSRRIQPHRPAHVGEDMCLGAVHHGANQRRSTAQAYLGELSGTRDALHRTQRR
jgi:hypothetical protein